MKNRILIFIFVIFLLISCNNFTRTTILGNDSTLVGKYKTEYSVHYNTNCIINYVIYSDNEVYTCSFQGTNFLLEKNNKEEILSTTAPIQIIKSEIVK